MRLKPIQGGFVSYSFNFLPLMRFSATAGLSELFNFDFEPDDAFSKSRYLAVNVFYQPIETIVLGLELTNGTRVNKDKQPYQGHHSCDHVLLNLKPAFPC